MNKIEQAVQWALNIANSPLHGYDQTHRWGPDYDCSSLLITAWENAGVKVKTGGATYTGNMYNVFLKCGFKDVTKTVNLKTGSGIQRGDVLLNKVHHTAMSIGNGKLVMASINEKGKAVGGITGDQTGREIYVRNYYNYPWDCVLRYNEVILPMPITNTYKVGNYTLADVKYGDKGQHVLILQQLLNQKGYNCGTVDGNCGIKTLKALANYQADTHRTTCGKGTWETLLK